MAIKPLAASEAISPTIESYKPDLNKSPGQVRADRGQLPGAGGRRRGCGAFAILGAGQDTNRLRKRRLRGCQRPGHRVARALPGGFVENGGSLAAVLPGKCPVTQVAGHGAAAFDTATGSRSIESKLIHTRCNVKENRLAMRIAF